MLADDGQYTTNGRARLAYACGSELAAGGQSLIEITSVTNPKMKHLVALRRRRVRDGRGSVSSRNMNRLDLALAAGVRPRELYVCRDLTARADPRSVEVRVGRC